MGFLNMAVPVARMKTFRTQRSCRESVWSSSGLLSGAWRSVSAAWEDGIMRGSKVFTGAKHLRE